MKTFNEWLKTLNEMFVHNLAEKNNSQKNIIAFRSNLWILPQKINSTLAKEIWDTIIRDSAVTVKSNIFSNETEESMDLINNISEKIEDCIVGIWDKEKRIFYLLGANYGQSNSLLMKKVINTLKIKSVKYYDEGHPATISKNKIEPIPYEMYHGTSSKNLYGIFKTGIRPSQTETNYPGVVHNDLIFLTNNFGTAGLHASNAAYNHCYYGKEKNKKTIGIPIVLKIKIPDKSLLVPDYDSYLVSNNREKDKTYDYLASNTNDFDDFSYSYSSIDPFKTSKHQGKFGYRGRIPPNHIVGLWGLDKVKWIKINLRKFLKKQEQYGTEEALYYFGIIKTENI